MNFLAVKIIVLVSIYSVNVKIHEKSGKYAAISIMIYIELSDIKKTDHLKNGFGLSDRPETFWEALLGDYQYILVNQSFQFILW